MSKDMTLETKMGPDMKEVKADFAATFAAFKEANDARLAEIEQKADPMASLDRFADDLSDKTAELARRFNELAENQDWVAARSTVRNWQFLRKLRTELDELAFRLDEQLDG